LHGFKKGTVKMSNKVKVFKFGGASIKDVAAIKNVGSILKRYPADKLLIVVSAMGKTTNALEKVLEAYAAQNGKEFEYFEAIKAEHQELLEALFPKDHEIFAALNDTFIEIEWVIEEPPQDDYDYLYDQIVSIGEMVSSKIIAAYLNLEGLSTQWLDARDVIQTDNTYRDGKVNWEETNKRAMEVVPPLFSKSNFVLTQGFIGGTSENFTTTLGREGSDYSAAIFSYSLDAESMSIWKDVPGILTGDPRLFDDVTKIDRLSYKEAIEMTYYGAKVIHPKTIKPIQNKNIPLYVKSFEDPEAAGTIISEEADISYPPVVVVESVQVLLHISTRDFSFVAEHHLSHLFQLFAKHRIKINMMQNMAISFSVCVTDNPRRLADLLKELHENYNVRKDENLELITIRHYKEEVINSLLQGKVILFEERIRETVQMVVRDVPVMKRRVEPGV
jgi:aspartate kinase